MATVKIQNEDKIKAVKAQAAAAKNVPQMREAIATLIQANEELVKRIEKLEKRIGR